MILVTGATGHVGTEVVRLLSARGIPARALVHRPEKVHLVSLPGIEPVVGDFEDIDSIRKALEGVNTVFLLTHPSLRQADHQMLVIDTARETGVRKIVKLSALGASKDSSVLLARMHAKADHHLMESGIAYTILRPHYFLQNTFGWLDTIRSQGAFYAPMMDGRISLIDVRDVAEVAVAALTEDAHVNLVYELTGPEALTFGELADKLSDASGMDIRFVDVYPEQARRGMMESGYPDWLADSMLELMSIFSMGYASAVSDTVEKVTGHGARSFDTFARELATYLERKEAAAIS